MADEGGQDSGGGLATVVVGYCGFVRKVERFSSSRVVVVDWLVVSFLQSLF